MGLQEDGGEGRLVVSLFDDWIARWQQRQAARARAGGGGGKPVAPRLFTVGRLDVQSVGLIFVTNDGDWAHRWAAGGLVSAAGCGLQAGAAACLRCRAANCTKLWHLLEEWLVQPLSRAHPCCPTAFLSPPVLALTCCSPTAPCRVMHPSSGITKEYSVTLDRKPRQEDLTKIAAGERLGRKPGWEGQLAWVAHQGGCLGRRGQGLLLVCHGPIAAHHELQLEAALAKCCLKLSWPFPRLPSERDPRST